MTALNLLRASDEVKVLLIDRRAPFGRGLAYAARHRDHMLNVRAAKMSAWPDAPDHFANWLAAHADPACPAGFATRGQYGAYLQDLLARVAEGSRATGRLVVIPDEVVDLRRVEGGWDVRLAMGRSLGVRAVVLAVGNLPPRPPPGVEPTALASPLYRGDPWRDETPFAPATHSPILLIGTGLTMVDVAISLQDQAPGHPMLALSRRGLSPQAHSTEPLVPCIEPVEGGSPVEVLARLRREAARQGWRQAVDALRPRTQALWASWSPAQRAAFLRHARPYWDVHRHRLAPSVAERMAGLLQAGTLRIVAGRIRRLTKGDAGLELDWSPRGQTQAISQRLAGAINCTGPAGDPLRAGDPLLDRLVAAGRVRPDPLRLGFDVTDDGRLIDRDGVAAPDLFAVGPVTRGAFWEITAVPDIRHQAVQVAGALLARLSPAG
ncbi:MAG: FAD/NAD(P)-binding protein [Caulobacter sp.]|nr:FAD/NAD(P)-binding protein [Caulobacter sp.]